MRKRSAGEFNFASSTESGILLCYTLSVTRQRIDTLIVQRKLAESRARAQALIMAGQVQVKGKPGLKPGTLVGDDAEITITEPPRYVSRGGIKLARALHDFRMDVSGKVVADIGASTGGFTDCLLQRGAKRVYAVDVGYGQLDYRLRKDPRVVVMERVNARYPLALEEKIDLATIDVSFISAQKIIHSLRGVVKENGYLLVLVKPQFEAGKEEVGRGGLIKDPQVHAAVLARFLRWLVDSGYRLKGLTASPILGASGNKEFFLLVGLT